MKPKNLYTAIIVLSLLAVGTQSALGTKYIPSDTSIGTWDDINRIYTLTTDVFETIQIDEDNFTLDGAGYTATGPGTGNGVYLSGRTDVTIQNLTVNEFSYGIYLYNSSNNTLTGNTVNSNNHTGIFLHTDCHNNTLTGNTANSNTHYGIYLYYSSSNTVTGNTTSNSLGPWGHGIFLQYSNNNTVTGNIARQHRLQ
jgi:parallel beta-helix repeat protein